jgi:hypothetical protein
MTAINDSESLVNVDINDDRHAPSEEEDRWDRHLGSVFLSEGLHHLFDINETIPTVLGEKDVDMPPSRPCPSYHRVLAKKPPIPIQWRNSHHVSAEVDGFRGDNPVVQALQVLPCLITTTDPLEELVEPPVATLPDLFLKQDDRLKLPS